MPVSHLSPARAAAAAQAARARRPPGLKGPRRKLSGEDVAMPEAKEYASLSGPRPQIPSRRFHHPGRPGGDGAHPAQRLRHRPHRARLHAHRRARRRQDHDRPHPRPGAELRRPGRQGRPDGRSLRRLRALHGHHRGPPRRRDRDGRRLAHRRRRHARADRGRALPRRSRRATRSTSSTKCTCCRRRPSTRC